MKEAVAAWKVVEPDLTFNELMVNMEVTPVTHVLVDPSRGGVHELGAFTCWDDARKAQRKVGGEIILAATLHARKNPSVAETLGERDDQIIGALGYTPAHADEKFAANDEACPCGKKHTRAEHGYRA